MSRAHSRNVSEETATSEESSEQAMVEHLLQYPASYEIPLRTMYTLNCAPRAQPPPRSASTNVSPVSGQFIWPEVGSHALDFSSMLTRQMSTLPSQPVSLPPAFIIAFVSRCFHPNVSIVDFPQALTAMDYLKDLEMRRRREVAAAFNRLSELGLHAGMDRQATDELAKYYPGTALWVNNIQAKEKKAEAYYTALYVGLRRWVMIHELSLAPFNKHNCVGMLNTLFPPRAPSTVVNQPTKQLTAEVLDLQRKMFFEYIRTVELKGPAVLKTVIAQGAVEGDPDGWPYIQESVAKYLRVAKSMIDDCENVQGPGYFASDDDLKNKKTDSGVSFGSSSTANEGGASTEKPLAGAYSLKPSKGLSKLEKIGRELRRMRFKVKPEVEEIIKYEPTADGQKKLKSLKKAKSFGSLSHLRRGNASSTSVAGRQASDAAVFDPEEMRRHRELYEQRQVQKMRVGHKAFGLGSP